MRKLQSIIILIVSLYSMVTKADDIKFTIIDGVNNDTVRNRIESSVCQLLNEINVAYTAERNLNFDALNVNSQVQQSMVMLWENTPFVCADDEIIEHCIPTGSGYQVRNIPLMMKPTEKHEFKEDEYQEAVINFDKHGNVESFYLSIPAEVYMDVIKSNLEQKDLRCRQKILDFIEQFRTAFNNKDIAYIDSLFVNHFDGTLFNKKGKRKFKKRYKRIFLSKTHKMMKKDKKTYMTIDEIEVMRHPVNPYFWGITLLQKCRDDKKNYDGYIFMLWDFIGYLPMIHVFAWQPDKIGSKPLPKDEVFSLSDFDI